MTVVVKKQNVRIYGIDRPEKHNGIFVKSPDVVKRRTALKNDMLGPYVFENGILRDNTYQKMLIKHTFRNVL